MLTLSNLVLEARDNREWYHYTSLKNAESIVKSGFKRVQTKSNHYGYGTYFTERSNIEDLAKFQWDGQGLNIFNAGKKFGEVIEAMIRDNDDASDIAEEVMGYDGWNLDDDGFKVWEKMDEIAPILGYDGFILEKTFSMWDSVLIVYDLNKLNDLLRTGKIKRIA